MSRYFVYLLGQVNSTHDKFEQAREEALELKARGLTPSIVNEAGGILPIESTRRSVTSGSIERIMQASDCTRTQAQSILRREKNAGRLGTEQEDLKVRKPGAAKRTKPKVEPVPTREAAYAEEAQLIADAEATTGQNEFLAVKHEHRVTNHPSQTKPADDVTMLPNVRVVEPIGTPPPEHVPGTIPTHWVTREEVKELYDGANAELQAATNALHDAIAHGDPAAIMMARANLKMAQER
jgi:hypothetical protein